MNQSFAASGRFRPLGGWSFAWLVPALLLGALSAFADTPKHLQDHFSDLADKVTDADDSAIENKLAEASTSAEAQLVLVVINKFSDYPGLPTNAKDFAYTLAKDWKVGSKSGKGIVVLFSLGDRQFHVVKTKNIPVQVTERIASSMRGEVTMALRDGKVGEAMSLAADIIVKEAPKSDKVASSPSAVPATPVSTPNQRPQVHYDTHTRQTSNSGVGIGALVIGGIILLVIIIAVVSAFSNRGYSDGGGFWSGMLVGGMMSNMFGGHSSSNYGGGSHSSGSSWGSDSGGTSSWGSWGGGDSGSSGGSSWDSGSSWSSGGGDSSSFGGGDFGGGSSGGEW